MINLELIVANYIISDIDNFSNLFLIRIVYYLHTIINKNLLILIKFYIFRFKTNLAKEIIQETFLKFLKDKEYSQIQADLLSKAIASDIKDKLKGAFF